MLYLSNLCMDVDDESSETPLIPNFVLDARSESPACPDSVDIFSDCCAFVLTNLLPHGLLLTRAPHASLPQGQVTASAPTAIAEMVERVSFLLQMQIHLAPTGSALFSPLLSRNVLAFFATYLGCYVDPNPGEYPEISAENAALRLHGAEFNEKLLLLFTACHCFMTTTPLETDLIGSCAQILKTVSPLKHRTEFILSLPTVHEVFGLIAGGACRLTPRGLCQAWEGLSHMASAAPSSPLFAQLCAAAQVKCARLSEMVQSGECQMSLPKYMRRVEYPTLCSTCHI